MPDYNAFLSSAARHLHASAIRRAGDVAMASPDLVSLAPGFPDASAFPWDDFRAIADRLLTGAEPSVLQYGPTRGYPPLLDVLPHVLSRREIHATRDEIIVTTGSQQALDLCARLFADPGDTVLVELPAYTGGLTAFGNAQTRLVGVRNDAQGIDLDHLDATMAAERSAGRRIALLYVVPNFQNPSGLLMSVDRRRALLEWAQQRDVLIVEDDPYGALYFDDVAAAADTRPIKADDQEGRVVYLSSFSKTVAPGFRVAWITAPRPIVSKLEILKQSADLCSGTFDQRFIVDVWTSGLLEERLPILREVYRRKRDMMETALARELGDAVSWTRPRGGFFLWAKFGAGIDADELLKRAVAHGVVYVPGSAFYVADPDRARARLAFSGSSHERIEAGAKRLGAAVRGMLEARVETTASREDQSVTASASNSLED